MKPSQDRKKPDLSQFTANLFVIIQECQDIMGLLKEFESYKEIMPPIQKARVQKYLVDLLVIRLHTLFDRDKNVFSFERLLHEYMSGNSVFKKKYSEIKKTFKGLIDRIENNRTKVAHSPKWHSLGFSDKELRDFEKAIGVKIPDPPRVYEEQHILYNNLPRDGIVVLLQELKHLVFYDVLYPQAKRQTISEIFSIEKPSPES